jgi:hypothetical protein
VGEKRNERIKALLDRQYRNDDFDLAMSELLELQTLVRERCATAFAPILNSHIANQPQYTHDEKLAVASKIRSALRTLGLALRYPESALPANIFVEKSSNAVNGRFQLDLRSRTEGHKRQSFSNNISDAPFFPLQLMLAPLELPSWSTRIREENSDALGGNTSRRESRRSKE